MIDKAPILAIPPKAFGDKHFAAEFNKFRMFLLSLADQVNVRAQGYTGFLKISEPAPAIAGLYKLIEIGTYSNLTPAVDANGQPSTIVSEVGKVNEAYYDGVHWIKSEVEIIEDESLNYNINNSLRGFVDVAPINTLESTGWINFGNGTLIPDSNYSNSGLVEIFEGYVYEITDVTYFYAFYDENGVFVPSNLASQRSRSFIKESGVKYIRYSCYNPELADFKIYKKALNNNDSGVLLKSISDNLIIDLAEGKWFNGGIIGQTNGIINQITGYSYSDFISVSAGKKYKLTDSVYQQYAFYNSDGAYVSDSQSANGIKTFTVPANAAFIRLSKENSQINQLFFNDEIVTPIKPKTISVGVNRDYSDIMSAVEFARSTGEVRVLEIDAGFYDQELTLITGVTQSLIGKSNRDTVITRSIGEPIKMKAGYYCRDIRVYNSNGGYALHHDYAGAGVTEFFNCDFETPVSTAVGIGLHENQTLIFRNCRFFQRNGSFYGGPTLYMHNRAAAATNQRIEFWDCEIFSEDEKCLKIDDARQLGGASGSDSLMTLLFVRNSFKSIVHGIGNDNFERGETSRGSGYLVGNNVLLDELSHGNTITDLNAF